MKRKVLTQLMSFILTSILLLQTGIPNVANAEDTQTNLNLTTEIETICDTSYDALLSGILGDVPSPSYNGIWINNDSTDAFLGFINNVCNQSYDVDGDGYLYSLLDGEANIYDTKMQELIDGDNTIIVGISNTYNAYNDVFDEIYSTTLEDGDFALLFTKSGYADVVVLNYNHYVNHCDSVIQNDEFSEPYYYSDAELMNYFLEIYYPNVDFIQLTKDIELTDEAEAELLVDDSELNYQTESAQILSTSQSLSNYSTAEMAFVGIQEDKGFNQDDIEVYLNSIPSESGIWINESSTQTALNYINIHSNYTYSVDSNGYLQCDNVEKDNEYLDCTGETEVDRELNFVIENDWTIAIGVDEYYYDLENGTLNQVYFSSDEYVKTYTDSETGKHIVVLNSAYFNMQMGYNLAISDRFVKNIFPKGYVPQTLNLDGATATMNTARTVYHGPSASNYATVGSVDDGEDIAILGKTVGWYYIAYLVGSTSNFKTGYVPEATVSNISGTVEEETYEGGYRYASSALTVKSNYLFDYCVNSGTIYAGEGFTLLDSYTEYGENISLVEFSTPSGTKRGFVSTSSITSPSYTTYVARVSAVSTPAYAGSDNSYVKLGGVYKNEYVAVLASEDGWKFVEYNTTSGRKRGYISSSSLDLDVIASCPDFDTHSSLKKATAELNVYGGPNSNYAQIGTIFNQEVVSYIKTERSYAYIEYTTTNGAKRGYVDESYLTTATALTIPTITTYSNFTSGTYGSSGLNHEPLKWYKLGSGTNIVFAIFEQHGWEDAWAGDGVELINIANTMMSNLSNMNQSIFDNWTIYVVPYANPDGITDGYTNNGPGRCTVSTKIDMNRCWPANFTPYYTSRNYTGASSLGAPEAYALKTFIQSQMGSSTNVVLDIHGWLDKTYGNSEIGAYFDQQLGCGHNTSYGSGYLINWAYGQGAKSCLIEFPKPSSSDTITSQDYAGKLTTGLVNMIAGLSGGTIVEGGEDVNETCQISSSGSVNVRSGPGTTYSKIASLANGTTVTRIKKSVATANGYTWDKILLSDGTIGYVATNYLVVVEDAVVGYEKYQSYDDIMVVKAYLKYETICYTGVVDKEYNNELIGAVEEYQKALNLTTQDGTLDAETLTTMGFTVDDSGVVINNDYYQSYFKRAINYQNGYDPDAVEYVELVGTDYYVGDVGRNNRFVLGKTATTILPSVEQSIIDMEAKYGALTNDNETLQAERQETIDAMELLVFGGNTLGMENAVASLSRYLDNTGDDLEHSNIIELIQASESSETLYNDLLLKAIAATELMMPNKDGTITFSLDYEETGNCTRDDSTNWYASINEYRVEVVCSATKTGNTYNLTFNYNIRDYYDWIEGSDTSFDFVVASVTQDEGFQLHYAGEAKAFNQYGTSIANQYTWTKGNSQTVEIL